MRLLRAALVSAVFIAAGCGREARAAPPPLYVYEGAGCSGANNVHQMTALLGRRPEGVMDFIDWSGAPDHAVASAQWLVRCWKGQGYRLTVSVPMAFRLGGSLADAGSGKLDATYQAIGKILVENGFADADLRLGEEENFGWYPWRSGQNVALWKQAFAHLYGVLKAVPGSHFRIWYNPGVGWGQVQQKDDFPGLGVVDGIAWDAYATSWASLSPVEPGLWLSNFNNSWGFKSVGSFYGQLPNAITEFGVGSRSDGHGAPAGSAVNGGDDPMFMSQALAHFAKVKSTFVGYWDYNAGDYNSKISDGSRPQETKPFLEAYASPAMWAIYSAHAAPFTTQPPPKVTARHCHAIVLQNAPDRWLIIVWAIDPHPDAAVSWSGTMRANRYDPASPEPAQPVESLGAADSYAVAIQPDRPVVIEVSQ
ncbi:MAG: hypothetical protein JO303_10540 [Caulobacteraceae bacterium]|nr:hypothetical protein [Caulobacteraceae bacterium]